MKNDLLYMRNCQIFNLKMHVEHYFNSVKNQQALFVEKASVQSSILSVDWSTDEGIFVKKFKNGS